MGRKQNILTTAILFLAGGIVYLIFEISAPFCAKNVCCTSSGGYWSLVPLIYVMLFIVGFCWLVCNVILYTEEVN